MAHKKKSWQEKLADSKDLPRVCDATKSKRGGTGTLVIPAPLEVDARRLGFSLTLHLLSG
jgi:hypothetical protein